MLNPSPKYRKSKSVISSAKSMERPQTVPRSVSTCSMSKYTHLTDHSPLRRKDTISRNTSRSLPPIGHHQRRERNYVIDAIKTDVYFNSPFHRPKRTSIIRPYDAKQDRHSAGYFRSPVTREVIDRTFSAQDYIRIPSEKKGLHRMSARRRSIPSPPAETKKMLEHNFVLDNIRSERLRNKQNPVYKEYNAEYDRHTQRYFRRRLVQQLLRKTITEPQRLYPTITFYAPTKNDLVV